MKRKNNLYKKICDIDVIMNMYDNVIRINTKNKNKIKISNAISEKRIKRI